MLDWINSNFTEYMGPIIVYGDILSDAVLCDKEWLADRLNGLSTPPTHAELSNHELANQNWQYIFDDWKDKGVIK